MRRRRTDLSATVCARWNRSKYRVRGRAPRAEILLWAASDPGCSEKLASRGMFPGRQHGTHLSWAWLGQAGRLLCTAPSVCWTADGQRGSPRWTDRPTDRQTDCTDRRADGGRKESIDPEWSAPLTPREGAVLLYFLLTGPCRSVVAEKLFFLLFSLDQARFSSCV